MPRDMREVLRDAETCLIRLREAAKERRYQPEERDLVKLLDDVGAPLAYLLGFVEASTRPKCDCNKTPGCRNSEQHGPSACDREVEYLEGDAK